MRADASIATIIMWKRRTGGVVDATVGATKTRVVATFHMSMSTGARVASITLAKFLSRCVCLSFEIASLALFLGASYISVRACACVAAITVSKRLSIAVSYPVRCAISASMFRTNNFSVRARACVTPIFMLQRFPCIVE